MKYFALLPIAILFELLAKILSPVLPLFANKRWGFGNNNNEWVFEPRLPVWLGWFDTPDNSLWGDAGWRTQHCKVHWDDYLGMSLWLWRNTAGGFSHNAISALVFFKDVRSKGDPSVSVENPGRFVASDDRGHWQFKVVTSFGSRMLYLNFGWLMDHLVQSGKTEELCHYKFSIKIPRKPQGATNG